MDDHGSNKTVLWDIVYNPSHYAHDLDPEKIRIPNERGDEIKQKLWDQVHSFEELELQIGTFTNTKRKDLTNMVASLKMQKPRIYGMYCQADLESVVLRFAKLN